MHVGFWGVRGSLPAPRRDTWRYGGNTPCLEVRAGQQIIILDAGTGILDLGRQLCLEFAGAQPTAHLLCTHYHWDHVQGLPLFAPLYDRNWTLYLYGPRSLEGRVSLSGLLSALFAPPFFPIAAKELPSTRHLRELTWKNDFVIGDLRVRTCRLHHPQGALAIRLDHQGSSLVYAPDHEPGDPVCDHALRHLARNADVLISDARFRPDELRQRTAWGHGSWEHSVALARDASAKNLVLFHHDPFRADLEIDHFVGRARESFPHTWAASEGMVLDISRNAVRVGSAGARLSQRTPLQLPVQVETIEGGLRVVDDVRLENISFQGAYFLSPRAYADQQPVQLSLPVRAQAALPADRSGVSGKGFRLRGYVLRTEPQTTNGGWVGVAVHFPGVIPRPREAVPDVAGAEPEAAGSAEQD